MGHLNNTGRAPCGPRTNMHARGSLVDLSFSMRPDGMLIFVRRGMQLLRYHVGPDSSAWLHSWTCKRRGDSQLEKKKKKISNLHPGSRCQQTPQLGIPSRMTGTVDQSSIRTTSHSTVNSLLFRSAALHSLTLQDLVSELIPIASMALT